MTNNSDSPSTTFILLGVIACFVLSGFAALLYQTAWMRQFSLVFGTSELAIAAVLSAYMGGLALGASIAAKFIHHVTRPVLFYGLLEAGIAISALAVPWLLKLASLLYVFFLGGQPEPVDASGLGQSFFYLIVGFIVLAIPTSLMGATLPLLTKYVVQSKEQIGSRVGLLYATNTLGAIAGTVIAGFVLLPLLGLMGTVVFGVVINLVVFVLAAVIAKHIGDHSQLSKLNSLDEKTKDTEEHASEANNNIGLAWRTWILPIMLVSGATSFVYEVLWTRLLGHILGGSITAFATMLAGFLSGIAIGSAIASRFASTRSQSILLFILVQGGIGITSMMIYEFLPLAIPETAGLKGNVVLAIMILLPATVFIGATFPLAVRVLARNEIDAASASARVYSWNTVGAILGATAAAFFLIPLLKYEGAVKLAVIVNLALAFAAALLLGNRQKLLIAGSGLAALAVLILYQPKMPEDILRASPVFAQEGGEIQFYEVGRSATVLVVEKDGFFNLRTNGLPEASTIIKGSPPSRHNQLMLSTLPVLARPDTESMLVIGLGAGVALEGVPKSVKEVDVIELEPQVVAANEFLGNRRAKDPLQESRVKMIINDARSALTLTTKKYDAIVSQPSHPWTAGASHLYTREFMSLARNHLSEDGVFLQWMSGQFVDEYLLKSLCRTMLDVFTHVRVYQWSPGVLFFLGSEQPLQVEEAIAKTGRPLNDDILGYLEKGVGSVEDVITTLAMDQENIEAYALGGDLITDNHNIMATLSARVMDNDQELGTLGTMSAISDYDPLLQADGWAFNSSVLNLNYPYIGRRLENLVMKGRGIALADSLVTAGNPQSLVMIGIGQELQGEREESQKNILLALKANPTDMQARYALLQPWFSNLLNNQTVPDYVTEELSKMSGTGLAAIQGWMAVNNMDMHALARLDSILAQVRPSDLWYQTSVKLRAEWRIRVTTPQYQPRLANEATALIDSAIAFFQDPNFLVMRIKSTQISEDYVASMVTARRLLLFLNSQFPSLEAQKTLIPETKLLAMESQLQEVTSLLNAITGNRTLDADDIALLAEERQKVDIRLSALQKK